MSGERTCDAFVDVVILRMMRSLFSRLDRSIALGVGVLVASLALLAVAFVSIFAALNNDGANLPEEGTLQEILGETAPGAVQGDVNGLDLGPLPAPPTRLAIPRLYIDAPVVTMGLDGEGNPQVPDRPDQVAWYNFAAAPGQRSNAVLSGHVDWQTQSRQPIPGVFYRLRELELGDKMTISLEDGTKLEYRVTGNVATAYEDPNISKAMSHTSKEVITLITCGGTWVRSGRGPFGGSYSHRVLVRAERLSAAVDALEAGQ
jgi:LPXTG-site transpeptidase (sortase) family protein